MLSLKKIVRRMIKKRNGWNGWNGWVYLLIFALFIFIQIIWIFLGLRATISYSIKEFKLMMSRNVFLPDLKLQSFSTQPSSRSISTFTLSQLREYLWPTLSYHYLTNNYPSYNFEPTEAQSAMDQSSLIQEVVKDYKRLYQRSPPRHFSTWIKYALLHNVTIDLNHYSQIQNDMEPFRRWRSHQDRNNSTAQPGITSEDLQIMRSLPEVFFLELLESSQKDEYPIRINGHVLQAMPAFDPLLMQALKLGRSLRVLPDRYFAIVMNGRDEPRSLPSDKLALKKSRKRGKKVQKQTRRQYFDRYTDTSPAAAYMNPHHLLLENTCMQDLYERSTHPNSQESLSSWHPNVASFAMSFTTISRYELPIFSDCKLPCYTDILIPRTEHREYNKLLFVEDPKNLKNDAQRLPSWSERKDVLFFRGGSAYSPPESNINKTIADTSLDIFGQYLGWRKDKDKWEWNLRFTLYRWAQYQQQNQYLSQFHPHIGLDINITDTIRHYALSTDTSTPSVLKEDATYVGNPTYVDEETQQVQYKYLLVPDGNTWASRFRRHLSLGAVILYQSIFITWWQARVVAFRDYIPIPVERSLQGLTDIWYWLQTHPQESAEVARAGRDRAVKYLRDIDLEMYTLLAWMEYAELCQYCQW